MWSPCTVHGLLQTRNYARVILSAETGVTEDQLTARLNDRMNRQQRILYRDEPPHVWFVVDELSLYRRVGSAEVMAEQCAHLLEVAQLSHVTLTVMPAIEHNANASGFIIGDGAAYAESAASSGVHTDQTVSELLAKFGNLQADSHGRSQSLGTIEKVGAIWARGVSPLTQAATGRLRRDGQRQRHRDGPRHDQPGRRNPGVQRRRLVELHQEPVGSRLRTRKSQALPRR